MSEHYSYRPSRDVSGRRIARRPERLRKIGVFAVVLVAIIAVCFKSVHGIVAESVKGKNIIFAHRVRPGDKFSTGYIHSVELSPVREYFQIDDRFRIVLYETTFCSSNVGLPYAAFGQEVFHTEADKFRISNMHRVIPELLIWANEKYENQLEFRGVFMALYGVEGDALIRVRITKMPLIKFACLVLRGTE